MIIREKRINIIKTSNYNTSNFNKRNFLIVPIKILNTPFIIRRFPLNPNELLNNNKKNYKLYESKIPYYNKA